MMNYMCLIVFKIIIKYQKYLYFLYKPDVFLSGMDNIYPGFTNKNDMNNKNTKIEF